MRDRKLARLDRAETIRYRASIRIAPERCPYGGSVRLAWTER